jgi:hypothetical protein
VAAAMWEKIPVLRLYDPLLSPERFCLLLLLISVTRVLLLKES